MYSPIKIEINSYNLLFDYGVKNPSLKAIMKLGIEINKIDIVFKLSQDSDVISQQNIIDKHNGTDNHSQVIASEMDKGK